MPRLAICSRDLHWHWINRTLLCDTMEVSMLSRAWLTIAQHVFQPALTGRPELISRKIVSGEPGTKAIAVSRFREKLSPANWVQGVTTISRKISRSWAPKKWGPTCDRDISNSAIYTTAIYRAYTVLYATHFLTTFCLIKFWLYSTLSDMSASQTLMLLPLELYNVLWKTVWYWKAPELSRLKIAHRWMLPTGGLFQDNNTCYWSRNPHFKTILSLWWEFPCC